jgi:hypothetical protein
MPLPSVHEVGSSLVRNESGLASNTREGTRPRGVSDPEVFQSIGGIVSFWPMRSDLLSVELAFSMGLVSKLSP